MFRMRMLNKMSLLLNVFLLSMLLIYDVVNTMESDVETQNNSTSTTTAVPVSNIMKRERSAMISNNLDSIKALSESEVEKTSTWSSRKFDLLRSRNLSSQRRLQNRRPSHEDCEKRCKNNIIDDFCRLKCRFDSETLTTLRSKREEILDVAASENVLNDFHKRNESEEAGQKEASNMINNNNQEKLQKDLKGLFESTTKYTTTGKINRRKYTRTSVLPTNQTRPTIYRGRIKYSPSSLRSKIKEENSEIITAIKTRLPYDIRTSSNVIQSTTPLITKNNDDVEIMEFSIAKQSSTEKGFYYAKARNIIAINNHMRSKFNPHLVKMSTDSTKLMGSTATTTTSTSTSIIKPITKSYEVIHYESTKESEKNINESLTNVTEAYITIPTKIIYKRPTTISNSVKNQIKQTFFADERPYQQSDGEFDNIKSIQTTPPLEVLKNFYETTSDDNLSTGISTIINTLKNENKNVDELTTTTKSTEEISIPSTLKKSSISSTISTVLSNVSSARNKESSFVSKKESITKQQTSTTPMTISKSDAKTIIPDQIEEVVQPSPKSFMTTTANQLHEQYEGISTTSKPSTPPPMNDVFAQSQNVTVYAAVGAIVILIIFIIPLIVRQYIFKNKKNNVDSENYSNDIQPISPVVKMSNEDGSCSEGDDSIMSESLEFNRNKLKFKSLLGEGNFGQVWKAEIEDQQNEVKIVAVKTERVNNGQGGLKAECEIMRKLLPAHANVVTLLGACIEQEPHLLIMSYEMRGKLLSLLRTARGVMNNGSLYNLPNDREPIMPLSPRRLTGFAYDIAKGMEYISGKGIVHGDIAARNVLVDHNGYCKICDFGMSIDLEKKKKQYQIQIPRVSSTYQNNFKFEMTTRIFGGLKNYAISKTKTDRTKNRPALPIRWMSPESLQFHLYTHESDVFAFGIVLWEIATLGITPYPTLTGREVIRGVIRDNIRPEIPPNCKLSQVMSQCWLKDPRERPSFFEIRKELARILNHWEEEISTNQSEYLDVSGFSEDYENGMIYFNRRVSEFECEI